MQQRKMAPVLKITGNIVLVICSIFVMWSADKTKSSVQYTRLVLRLISRRSFTILRGLWSMSDYCFVFWLARGHVKLRWGSV